MCDWSVKFLLLMMCLVLIDGVGCVCDCLMVWLSGCLVLVLCLGMCRWMVV